MKKAISKIRELSIINSLIKFNSANVIYYFNNLIIIRLNIYYFFWLKGRLKQIRKQYEIVVDTILYCFYSKNKSSELILPNYSCATVWVA